MAKFIGWVVILLVVAGLVTGVLDVGSVWSFLYGTVLKIAAVLT